MFLQPVAQLVQHPVHRPFTDRMTRRLQLRGQLRCTFAGPAQRTCRITTAERFNQLLQRRAQVRVLFAQPLAAPARSALPSRWRRWRTLRLRSAQFLQACAYRAACYPGRLEHPFDTATTDGAGFGRRPSSSPSGALASDQLDDISSLT